VASQLRIWAEANAARYVIERARLDAVGAEVTAFASAVDNSVAVSNVDAMKLKTIDDLGRWPSAFGFDLEAAGHDIAKAVANYETKQTPMWFAQREAVERVMGVTRTAVYASLALNGAGVPIYGEFCLVLDPDRVEIEGVLPFNSAEHYADEDGVANDVALEHDAATWDNRAAVATLRHEPELSTRTIGIDWLTRRETVLASEAVPSNFVEVVIVDPGLSLDTCDTVRIASDQYDALNKLDARVERGDSVTVEERGRVIAYRLLLDRQRAGRMVLEKR
jgi:hypothetical protein